MTPGRSQTLLVLILAAFVLPAVLVAASFFGREQAPAVAIGGPFRLMSQDGEILDSERLKGKPYGVFFGFTRCPEICPTTMMDMSALLNELGDKAKDFHLYFVSVDPERDTPAVLRDFLGSFEPKVTGLTGTPEEIAAIAKSFRVYYRKVPLEGGGYTMDHTAMVYLMDGEGRFAGVIPYQEDRAVSLKKLRFLLGFGPNG